MIKVPILVTTFDRVEHGQLRYDSSLTWADSLRYLGEDDLLSGAKIPLNQVTLMMITTSDNAAASAQMYRHLTRIYWNGEALSALLWRTFEPQRPWTPPLGAERFTP